MSTFEYDNAFNAHREITLITGRRIFLDSLHQSLTYRGLLAGTPCADNNDDLINRTVQEAHTLFERFSLLIEPERRSFRREPGDMDQILGNVSGDRITEWLPEITSIGSFWSFQPARDQTKCQSFLTIIWFQPHFGLPDERFVKEKLCVIDWEAHAADFDW